MGRFYSLLVILLLISPFVHGEDEHVSENVLTLDATNFQKTIQDNSLIAVEFYAPWCGHCKSLAPEWEKAATELKGKVAIAKVDCTEHQALCQQYDVQGFPTLKIFRSGEAYPLEVARKSEAIVSYLTKELEPAVTELSTEADLEAFLQTHPITLVAHLDNNHDDRFQEVNKLAQAHRHTVSFVALVDSENSKKKSNTLTLRRNFDSPSVEYSGALSLDAIKPWLLRSLVPLVGEISAETFQSYMATSLPIGYLFVNPRDDNTAILDGLKNSAEKLKDKVVLAWINNERYGQQANRLGLSGKSIPCLAVDNYPEGVRFLFPEDTEFTAAAVSDWLDQFAEGKLAPHIKSEPVPETNDGPVKVLVAHNYKEIVEDSTKDVLVEYYAPWCGHCKSLAPIYDELGNFYKSIPSVVIAKIDATANDVPPSLGIRGFPTIKFFPADNKQPLDYEGPRELTDLAEFVHRSAAIKFDLPAGLQKATEEEGDDEEEGNNHDEL